LRRRMFSRIVSAREEMENKMFSAVLLSTLLLSIVLLSSFKITSTTGGISDVEFYVSPATTFLYDTTPVGTRFNITVMWKDSGTPLNDVIAWQVKLTINATMINCSRAWQPTWDPDYLLKPREPNWTHPAPAGLGTSEICICGALGPPLPPPVHAASGKLAIFELEIAHALNTGDYLLFGINNYDTFWTPDGFNWYDAKKTNGRLQVPNGPPRFEVAPSNVTLGPGPVNGTEFTVDVNITGPPPSGLDACLSIIAAGFRLYYNNTLLEPVSLTEGSFFQDSAWNLYGTSFSGVFVSDGSGSYAQANDLIYPNSSGHWDQMSFPNGTGSIARISFRAIEQSKLSQIECNLTLDNCHLDNKDDNFIPMNESKNVNCHYTMLPRVRFLTVWKPTSPIPYVPSNITRADEPTRITANFSEPVDDYNVSMLLSYRVDIGEWWNTSMEYNSSTNLWTTQIPGQRNDSRVVEFFATAYFDVGSLRSQAYSYSVKPLLGSDINGDGKVDAKDVTYVCRDYGKKGP